MAATQARSDIDAIEQAALTSWPALEEARIDGWLLRAAKGYTRRTNSANTAGARAERLDADLPLIEGFFVQRGLAPTFRLLSTPEDEAIDQALGQRGYRRCDDVCSVMVCRLHDQATPTAGAPHRVSLLPDAKAWLGAFMRIKDDHGPHQGTHLAMLRAIAAPMAYATAQADGEDQAQCCGLGVLSQGHLGLFDIATHPAHRLRGLGTALCKGLLDWGRAHGAHTAYLQVVADNRPAVELYRRLGFEELYRYWYRARG